MKNYRVIIPVVLRQGKIRLTDAQAANRMHAIKKLGGNVYEIVTETGFKVGEEVGLDFVNKMQLPHVECLDIEKPAVVEEKKQPLADGGIFRVQPLAIGEKGTETILPLPDKAKPGRPKK